MRISDEVFDKGIKEGGFALEDLICDLVDNVDTGDGGQTVMPRINTWQLYQAFRKQKLLLAGLVELLDKKGMLRHGEIRNLLEDLRD